MKESVLYEVEYTKSSKRLYIFYRNTVNSELKAESVLLDRFVDEEEAKAYLYNEYVAKFEHIKRVLSISYSNSDLTKIKKSNSNQKFKIINGELLYYSFVIVSVGIMVIILGLSLYSTFKISLLFGILASFVIAIISYWYSKNVLFNS